MSANADEDMERSLVKRIDVGEDSILIYDCGGRTSLAVTTHDNGDAEILLDVDECESVANALRTALERDRSWDVWRQGDDGNAFLVKEGLTKREAEELAADFEGRKYKQTYWAKRRRK